ncbi:MAG: glutamate racemase [Candidatus Eremiobacteraeota bacterium]|nr:glutamate racemase [Candidatus Eremiobacteraeota bacterium]
MTLGIYDSGLGGVTVLRQLRDRLPHTDLLYFADQRHVPYGDRSDTELRGLLETNLCYLRDAGADAVVMGCNTSCAIAARYGWPAINVPVFDLIEAAAVAVARTSASRIGILATTATTRSGAYGAAIRARCPDAVVAEVAAPALVPLVESGNTAGPIAVAAVEAACAPLRGHIDVLVLACTHFPLLDDAFSTVLGEGVVRIDPAIVQAERAAAWVRERARPNGRTPRETRNVRFITSGALVPFKRRLAELGLDEAENAEEQQHGEAAERHAGDHLSGGVRLEVHP